MQLTPWQRFAAVARGGQTDRTPVALIVDSPWLPGYAGVNTLDYFLDPELWFRTQIEIRERFPDVAWIPGFWVEYGMAAEPSAFGARIVWHPDSPPGILPVLGGLEALDGIGVADPAQHGLMPLALQLYRSADRRLAATGDGIHMVAARGPLAIASFLLGITEFMVALKRQPERVATLLDVLTDTVIGWLRAQLDQIRSPEGILLLDDIPGMLSVRMYHAFAELFLQRIFGAFDGLIRVYHNDTPAMHLVDAFSALPFEVFNFSHEMDITQVQQRMPGKVLMGNVAPLGILVRGTPDQVLAEGRACIAATGGRGLILSAGGGASPGMPAESIDALVLAATGAPEL